MPRQSNAAWGMEQAAALSLEGRQKNSAPLNSMLGRNQQSECPAGAQSLDRLTITAPKRLELVLCPHHTLRPPAPSSTKMVHCGCIRL
jgi:hypothetical protein